MVELLKDKFKDKMNTLNKLVFKHTLHPECIIDLISSYAIEHKWFYIDETTKWQESCVSLSPDVNKCFFLPRCVPIDDDDDDYGKYIYFWYRYRSRNRWYAYLELDEKATKYYVQTHDISLQSLVATNVYHAKKDNWKNIRDNLNLCVYFEVEKEDIRIRIGINVLVLELTHIQVVCNEDA